YVVAAAARQDVDPAAAGKNVIRLRAAGDGVVSARARKLDQIRRRPVGERPGGGRKRSRHRDRDDVLVGVAGDGERGGDAVEVEMRREELRPELVAVEARVDGAGAGGGGEDQRIDAEQEPAAVVLRAGDGERRHGVPPSRQITTKSVALRAGPKWALANWIGRPGSLPSASKNTEPVVGL